MKVIVKLDNDKYYASKVFAIINNNLDDEYDKGWKYQYLVFDENNQNLVLINEFQENSKYLKMRILILDNDTSDMTLDENRIGKVNFLTDEEINEIINNKITSQEVLNKCKKYITSYNGEYLYIKNESDIKNLMWTSGGFHDGYIEDVKRNEKNELVVLFEGIWGCDIEIIFSPDVIYHVKETEDLDYPDKWWFDSKLLIHDDLIIFVDSYDYNINDNLDNYSNWFKARSMKYKIIPR